MAAACLKVIGFLEGRSYIDFRAASFHFQSLQKSGSHLSQTDEDRWSVDVPALSVSCSAALDLTANGCFAPHGSHSYGPVHSPKADIAIAEAAGSFAPIVLKKSVLLPR